MPIGIGSGTTEYSTQDVADATGVCVTAASRKLQQLEDRLVEIIAAVRAAHPGIRPCDLAAKVEAALVTGGQLAAWNTPRFRKLLRMILAAAAGRSADGAARRDE